MDFSDINTLQIQINQIALYEASPLIIITGEQEILISSISKNFSMNSCEIVSVYNSYKSRYVIFDDKIGDNVETKSYPITIPIVVAGFTTSESTYDRLIDDIIRFGVFIPDNEIQEGKELIPFLKDEYNARFEGLGPITINEYVSEQMATNAKTLKQIYSDLKNKINLTGKILSIQAIIGGIAYYYSDLGLKKDEYFPSISLLENEQSPIYMNETKIQDALEWYRNLKLSSLKRENISLYKDSLEKIFDINKKNDKIDIFDLEMQLEKVQISPLEELDILDLMSSAETSKDVPMIVGMVDGKKIIKIYNEQSSIDIIQPTWFLDIPKEKKGDMIIMAMRIARYPDKYDIVKYNATKNTFSVKKTNKYISSMEILSIICRTLKLTNITLPKSTSKTYTFKTNMIIAEKINPNNQIPGIDSNVLAWMIMNPPQKYKNLNLSKYVFVNEDVKPNSLRDYVSIHIQLGSEKLYLTFSKAITTGKTLAPIKPEELNKFGKLDSIAFEGEDIYVTGFSNNTPYLNIRVNKAPSKQFARIAQSLYKIVIQMYLENFEAYSKEIFLITGYDFYTLKPAVEDMITLIPNLTEQYSYVDTILYSYISGINEDYLPVPIHQRDVEKYKKEHYDVIKLPTMIQNNPFIQFQSSGEIWLRTPESCSRFRLKMKKNDTYIPICEKGNGGNILLISPDFVVNEVSPTKSDSNYVMGNKQGLLDASKINKLADIDENTLTFIKPMFKDKIFGIIYRLGISQNLLLTLNTNLGDMTTSFVSNNIRRTLNVKYQDVAQYAYLCKQECWDQTIDEIRDDILSGIITLEKHFRALEKAFQVNIYIIIEDPAGAYVQIPRTAYFYLHRKCNPEWKTILFHKKDPKQTHCTLLVWGSGKEAEKERYFPNPEYLDYNIIKTNSIEVVSPITDQSMKLETTYFPMQIGNKRIMWRAISQIIDLYGKCRALVYERKGDFFLDGPEYENKKFYITLGKAFGPVLDLPIGEIIPPSKISTKDNKEVIVFENDMNRRGSDSDGFRDEAIKKMAKDILYPSKSSELSTWIQREKNARVLRTITHLLYSVTPVNIDTFSSMIVVDKNINYDFSQLRNQLPLLDGDYRNAWSYFAFNTSGLISYNKDKYSILVPTELVRDTLIEHIRAGGKVQWPLNIPNLIQYSWDIKYNSNEAVFMNELELVNYLIIKRTPTESYTLIETTLPYIYVTSKRKYFVQMARSVQHATYIAYEWERSEPHINIGYNSEDTFIPNYVIDEVEPDFTDKINKISYCRKPSGTRGVFLLIPL